MSEDARFRRIAAICIAAASIALSLAWLAVRNIYDDELTSFNFILLPWRELWAAANSIDVHPPGMYAASKAALMVFRDERWMTLAPLAVLYAGLIVFAVRAGGLIKRTRTAYVLFLLIVFLHPHLLMWGNTIRWYGYWTGLALIVTSLWMAPKRSPVALGISTGVLLALMLYFNYLTFAFIIALVALAFIQDRSRKPIISLAIAAAILSIAAIPQMNAFWTVHRLNSSGQMASRVVAAMRLCHGVFLSEAMMPWTPAAIAFFVVVIVPLGIVFLMRARKQSPPVLGLAAMFALLFGFGVAFGLGGKARSFLLLCPLLAVLMAVAADEVKSNRLRIAFAAITALWIAQGSFDLLTRQGTAKAGINDHPEEIVRLITREAHGQPAAIFTHDVALTYALNKGARDAGENWSVVSFYPDTFHGIPRAKLSVEQPRKIFVIRTTMGSLAYVRDQVKSALDTAESLVMDANHIKMSPDPQASMKRRIPGLGAAAGDVLDYRYDVTFGDPVPGTSWTGLAGRFYIPLPGETEATAPE